MQLLRSRRAWAGSFTDGTDRTAVIIVRRSRQRNYTAAKTVVDIDNVLNSGAILTYAGTFIAGGPLQRPLVPLLHRNPRG